MDETYGCCGHDVLKPLQQLGDIGVDAICGMAMLTYCVKGGAAGPTKDSNHSSVGLDLLCSALAVGWESIVPVMISACLPFDIGSGRLKLSVRAVKFIELE